MTSKKCFNGAFIRENIRRFWWIGALYFVALFFALPFKLLSRMEYYRDRINEAIALSTQTGQPLSDYFSIRFFDFTNGAECVAFIIVPILLAVLLFSYMNSRKSADVVHSLPITRPKLYFLNVISGFLIYTIPLVVTAVLVSIIISAARLWTFITFPQMMFWLLTSILFLTVFLAISSFFAICSGNPASTVILTLVASYFPYAFYSLLSGTFGMWLYGYTTPSSSETFMNITPGIYCFSSLTSGVQASLSVPYVIGYIIFAAALLILGCVLYTKRKSENAGNMLVFKVSQPITKYILSFIFAVLFGIIIHALSGRDNILMLVAGYLIGGVIAYMFLHAVIHKNIKAIKTGMKGLYIFLAFLLLFSASLMFDFFGYQKRVPDTESVEVIYFDPLNRLISTPVWGTGYKTPENIELIRNLHKSMIAQKFGPGYSSVTGRTQYPKILSSDSYGFYYQNSRIEYSLKNGDLIRNYPLSLRDFEEYIIPLINSTEGKKNTYMFLGDAFNYPEKLRITDVYGNEYLLTQESQIRAVIDGMTADVLADGKAFSFELDAPYFGNISFEWGNQQSFIKSDGTELPMYYMSNPYFDIKTYYNNTLDALAMSGVVLPALDANELEQMELWLSYYDGSRMMSEPVEYYTEDNYGRIQTVKNHDYYDNPFKTTDPAEIALLSGALRSVPLNSNFYYNYEFRVSVHYKSGSVAEFVLDPHAIPDFVYSYYNMAPYPKA